MSAAQQNLSETEAAGSEHLAINDVYRLLKKEIEAESLQSIEPDTFQKIAASLGSLKGQGYEGIEAKVRDRMAELLAASARLLIEVRHRKMRSGDEPLDYSKLTDEEKYMLDSEKDSENRINEVVAATVKGRPKVLESISSRMRSKRVIVRFVKSMDKFVGVDMASYGPFQPEDVATLPFETARSFIESGTAVQVHAQL